MARQYATRKKGQMVSIHGFSEMVELLQQLEKQGVDEAADRIFDECTGIVKSSMQQYAAAALPADMAAKQTEWKVKGSNVRLYAFGFDRNKHPDEFLKACYLNYGTPHRYTAAGAYRGKINPRGFISNAKRSAAQKINARKKTMLKELLGGGGGSNETKTD